MSEPLGEVVTYDEVNRRLRFLSQESERVNARFEAARYGLAKAKDAYEKAHRKALLSDDCPKVRRDGCSAAERDAWADERCAAERTALIFAEAALDTATNTVFAVKDQASMAQTASNNLRSEMSLAGVR